MSLSETPPRELTEPDRRQALAAADKWKYVDSGVSFDEQKAYYLGYLNKSERTPADIDHLQRENEQLRQVLVEIRAHFIGTIAHIIMHRNDIAFADAKIEAAKSSAIIKIDKVLSKTYHPQSVATDTIKENDHE